MQIVTRSSSPEYVEVYRDSARLIQVGTKVVITSKTTLWCDGEVIFWGSQQDGLRGFRRNGTRVYRKPR